MNSGRLNYGNRVGFLILVGLLVVLPYCLPMYWQDVLVLFTINVLVIMSYRLIITMGGWSFAHVAIMGLGAYIMAMLTTKFFSVSYWVALPIGGLGSALFAMIISYPVLRTKLFYFFLSTFAAGEALRQCFIQFREVFGGFWGIPFIQRPNPVFGIDFTNDLYFYYLALIITIISGMILYRIDKSRIGRTTKAVAADDTLCESFGVNTWGYKATAHVVGSFFVGIAGALFASYNGIAAPTDFTSVFMYKFVAAAIIGGTKTFVGPILGLTFVTLLQEVFRDLQEWLPLVYGIAIVGILLFLPYGIESQLASVRSLLRKVRWMSKSMDVCEGVDSGVRKRKLS